MQNLSLNLPINDYLMTPVSCEKVFSPEECQKLIELPCSYQKYGETMQATGEHKEVRDFSIRYTMSKYVDHLPENEWVFARIHQLVKEINQETFKFRLLGFPNLQILEYPLNGFYRMHTDLGQGVHSTRKLSVVTLLSDPKDFEGGELMGADEEPIPLSQGMVVMFPAYLPHQVKPVLSGKRYSMVTWVLGPPYQ
ncbi:hypothetical protein COW36_07785 [bacterium (Candidatus Blackallbacteria) CG17_big_fil_post_rev_8_21_14_2_50_48_46]|uniref:Fe2OG dioxygenase domain-containing protein n=1 Tax=bacterium (Candidatus Blackallbacteria) CG17_big_fil_post_rev_8_21_14_2_50_48_46 TaxID=2014261 RepID=A0A2M7G7M8_9BACT|nr:MAG: hypothetical protein COW64_06490 [bacterium (Candidatus Blackallbacteria) CG18_big_fil_WC_8_21_14_2_50_49_26]PIW17739.1 MAG: hypothetical protein COW36_07785 [bacterium (Candidatus Blackallbacteria) CG17_big_fil_post_rev_8_21_14_2_50_48_46]PIW47767.1 MAG: hypothetical protein COW20_11345 [bacterium (Candidatus Blackallbacteria) CG13_big_fil_rev_8_21_14_2_50_49_14]